MVAEPSDSLNSTSGRVNGLGVDAPAISDGAGAALGNLRLRRAQRALEQSLKLRPWNHDAVPEPYRRDLAAASELVRERAADAEDASRFRNP